MTPIELPTLLFWENGNSWYGSCGPARFFIKPQTPEDGQDSQLFIQLWRGPLAMEGSEIIATAFFPVSEEGLSQTTAWLEAQAAELAKQP